MPSDEDDVKARLRAALAPNASMDERAANILRDALVQGDAAAERGRLRLQVILIHLGCALLYLGALALKYTALKAMPEEVRGAPVQAITLLWGWLGFPGAKAVVARRVASLRPQALNQMLSLRPPAAGNVLTSMPPPPVVNVRSPRL